VATKVEEEVEKAIVEGIAEEGVWPAY
jgi:hypothetical protein